MLFMLISTTLSKSFYNYLRANCVFWCRLHFGWKGGISQRSWNFRSKISLWTQCSFSANWFDCRFSSKSTHDDVDECRCSGSLLRTATLSLASISSLAADQQMKSPNPVWPVELGAYLQANIVNMRLTNLFHSIYVPDGRWSEKETTESCFTNWWRLWSMYDGSLSWLHMEFFLLSM